MSIASEGGPAFPLKEPLTNDALGMSLRDYFAAKALAAMISKDNKDGVNCGASGVPTLAAWAYEYADAMLKARLS